MAIGEAKKSNFGFNKKFRFRLGAVVIKDKNIISRGHNCKSPNPTFQNLGYDCSVHAEALSLHRAKKQGDTLIVVRVLQNGNLSMAFPCRKCYNLIKKSNIKNLYFSDWNGEIKKVSI